MSKQKDKCVFNESWLTDKRFSEWLKKETNHRAYCKFCAKDFDVSNIGVSALKSNAEGQKHREIEKLRTANTGVFFNKAGSTGSSAVTTVTKSAGSIQTLPSVILPLKVVKAEIIWVLKVVNSLYSLFNSWIF